MKQKVYLLPSTDFNFRNNRQLSPDTNHFTIDMETLQFNQKEELQICLGIMRNSAHKVDTRSYQDVFCMCLATECLLNLMNTGQVNDLKNLVEETYEDVEYILTTWKMYQPPRYHVKYVSTRVNAWLLLKLCFLVMNNFIKGVGHYFKISEGTKANILTRIGEHLAHDINPYSYEDLYLAEPKHLRSSFHAFFKSQQDMYVPDETFFTIRSNSMELGSLAMFIEVCTAVSEVADAYNKTPSIDFKPDP